MGLQKSIELQTKVTINYFNINITLLDFEQKYLELNLKGYLSYTDRTNGAHSITGQRFIFQGSDFTFSKTDTINEIITSCYEKIKTMDNWSDATDVLET
jgi:hypothetical protein